MKLLTFYEGTTKEAAKAFVEEQHMHRVYLAPKEDYLAYSDNPPVFAVADGVTLNYRKIDAENIPYPQDSPSANVARVFCETVIEQATVRYEAFDENDISDVFTNANGKVAEYNSQYGDTDMTGNITGHYAATGAFAVIVGSTAYYASICDAYVAHFDQNMSLKFMTTGACLPYAVINGEDRMANHIQAGRLSLSRGDRLLLFTDGFENYIDNQEFKDLLTTWSRTIEGDLSDLCKKLNAKEPGLYGHERTMIAIIVD